MELIYTDSELNDIGVLKEATSDFAFGKDENDFEIVSTKKYASLILGGYVYYDNTEYGGIVDSVEASNNNDEIKYNGRTWHGMLNSFIMDFDSQYMNFDGVQYSVISGVQAKDLIAELVEYTGLPITVDMTYDKELEPVSVDARIGLYDFLVAVLKPSMLKIYFRYNKGLTLYVSGASQFDDSANFDSKQMMITATKGRKFTNHFVLHNYQESENAHRILNLYTDEVGNIQPYTNVETPLEDSDYINATKVLSGADEVVDLLEDTTSKENYKLLTSLYAPKDWSYSDYYEYTLKEGTEDEYEYKKLEENDQEYHIENRPSMWDYDWSTYYKRPKGTSDDLVQLGTDDAPKTTQVTPVIRDGTSPQVPPPYIQLTKAQWADQWDKANYCTRIWDGNAWVYTRAEGITTYSPVKLASQPSDSEWGANKGNYYVYDSYTTYVFQRGYKSKSKMVVAETINLNQYNYTSKKVTNTKGKLVTLVSLCKNANQWYASNGKIMYYRLVKKTTDNSMVPISTYCARRGRAVGGVNTGFKFTEVKAVYKMVENVKKDPPTWMEPNQDHANPKGYFLVVDASTGVPDFDVLNLTYDIYAKVGSKKPYVKDTYYKKTNDHFVGLIEKAKEQLADELSKLEGARADLNIETYEFDVGDYVGGINPLTNEPFKSIVTKKIAKINSFNAEVSYEIG